MDATQRRAQQLIATKILWVKAGKPLLKALKKRTADFAFSPRRKPYRFSAFTHCCGVE
jgi:hypothetical protein